MLPAMMRLIILVVLLLLSAGPACTPLAREGSAVAPDTGIEGAFSRQAIIAEAGQGILIGRVLVLRQSGGPALIAEIGQVGRSGQGRLRMDSAWTEGERLPFRGATRSEPYCIGSTDCQGFRTGVLRLSRAAFDRAARTGLRATLIGPDAAVEIRFPPELFSEASQQAGAQGLWPP
jgi:hypothetical protein